jgi:2-keto-4-pentenoate hydratase/2-oxohepta-3-ene-1,7-dioic acid hydratase in catechol pathway
MDNTMRFLRLGEPGRERPAALIPGTTTAFDIFGVTEDIDGEFLRTWQSKAGIIRSGNLPVIDFSETRIGPPISRPHAVYGIALNYAEHAAEANRGVAAEPVVFSKAPNSLCGPHDDVIFPPGSEKGDWEVELGVVIGAPAYRLSSVDEALAAIAGYVAANDVSEREWQLQHGDQIMKGKSFPTANPIGPFLVTADEVPDPGGVSLDLWVNGVTQQHGTTANLIFSVEHLVWYLSQFARLEPGDLINTGTPAGVGIGHVPPVFLQDGDVMELSVGELGSHKNRIVIPKPA